MRAVTGADTQGLAVEAGRSANGAEINVLISNYEVPVTLRGPRPGGDKVAGYLNLLPRRKLQYHDNSGFSLKVNGLMPNQLYRVERYRISDVWDYRLLSTVTLKGADVSIADALPPPAIELVVIKSAKAASKRTESYPQQLLQ